MIGWTAMNYIPAFIIMVLIACMTTAWVAYWGPKDRVNISGFGMLAIMVLGMFGFFGLMAAPMDSVMQRDYWTAKLTAEAEAEQLEEELDAVLQEIAFGEITLTCEQIDAANREAGRLAAPCELTVGFTGVTNAHR